MDQRRRGKLLFSVTIKDCEVQVFRSGGKGGQHQNTSDTGVRVIHRPSGAAGESRETRSQLRNKQAAFRRMAESQKFKTWLNREIWLRERASPESQVRDAMRPENIRVEGKGDDGRWIAIG